MKSEDSMESTLKEAQKSAAQSSDSSKRSGMIKADTGNNAPESSNK